MALFIGTSGWSYPHWGHGAFYPATLPPSAHLAHYATRFDTVEINNSFYHLPSKETFRHWRETTPPHFTFTLKASRFITHMKKLADTRPHLAKLLDHASHLGPKLAVLLVQLPPFLHFDPGRLRDFLATLDEQRATTPGLRAAFEFRHPSWLCEECHRLLALHNAALVLADGPAPANGRPLTADFVYVRRHGHSPSSPGYPLDALRQDARHIRRWLRKNLDVFIYFNNDTAAHAPQDATTLHHLLANGASAPPENPG
jgi:uncharacterized protein YecE (DUF72 family)